MGKLKQILLAGAACAMLPLATCSNESPVDRALAQVEQTEPVMALIRQHEPGAYAEMRTLIERTVNKGGEANQQQLISKSREIFSKAIERRVMTAPDETVTKMVGFVADQTAHLESNPTICASLLRGTAGDVRPFIPVEMQERERKIYEELLSSPPGVQQKVADEQSTGLVIAGILSDAEAALGLSETAVGTALSGSGPALQICRANGYLMRRLSQLPANEGAPIFRLLTRTASQQPGG